jgi:hypothetical protein
MLRQLGPFSIFYTFSMADMKWSEFLRCLAQLVDGEELTLKEAKMPWKRKARLVRSEPVTSSRYHRHQMEALLTTMKRHSCISGKIVDYFWGDEFQKRGTPHTRMAVYVKKALVLGVNFYQEICDFANRYVTTSSERASVENLEAQQHQHSKRYCLRKSAVGNSLYYKFEFPKVPMLKTIKIRPLPLDLPVEDRRKHERTFENIRKTVKRLDDLQQKRSGLEPVVWKQECPSFDAFLRSTELSWSDHVLGLRLSVQKATIIYKRDLDAIRRNSYNEKILAMQNSNVDAQFVLDPYSAATYISSYMMKSNYALSKLMMAQERMIATSITKCMTIQRLIIANSCFCTILGRQKLPSRCACPLTRIRICWTDTRLLRVNTCLSRMTSQRIESDMNSIFG